MSRDQAIAYIKARGQARTPAIARELGMTPPDVDALLTLPCEQGVLVSCEVQVGDGQSVMEYRASAAAGTGFKYRPPNKPVRRAILAKPETTFGAEPNRSITALRPEIRVPPQPPANAEPKGEAVKPFIDKVSEIFRKHGPLTSRELKKHHGIGDASWRLNSLADRGTFARLGGTPKNTIFGLPEQKLADRKGPEAVKADKPPRSIHRASKHVKPKKHARKRAGGGPLQCGVNAL